MHTDGEFLPATAAAARDRYEQLGARAQVVVKAVAKAMAFDSEEYDQRVTGDVVETAREAMFGEQLQVRVGTREEFEAWREDADQTVEVIGADNVDNVAWHAPPFADRAVAATFQDEERAAVSTLRRQAVARLYLDVV
jgi:stalled ribosome rescue protein Dom34